MSKLHWRLVAPEEAVLRHCQGCGKTVPFRDSGKVRLNANGKQLFQFAIYKCVHDHTWNRRVPVTFPDSVSQRKDPPTAAITERLAPAHWRQGIEIELTEVHGKWRLDKVLAHRLEGVTRSRIVSLIKQGRVHVNGQKVEGNQPLRTGDTILVLPSLDPA